MASILGLHYFIALSLLFFLSDSTPQPNLLVLPVHRDTNTGLHWANLNKRTPLTQVPVLVDINGNHLWVNCEQHYTSQTYQTPFCHSTICSRANTHQCINCPGNPRPGCHKNACALMSTNPVTEQTGLGELGQDVLAIHATNGSQLGPLFKVPQFLFSCAPSFLTQKDLPKLTQGVAGLGHAPISLPNQLAYHFGLQRQFTTCLSRYPTLEGTILFGDAPNNMRRVRNQDVFRDLAYTPLTITPQGEYNVRIDSISINYQGTSIPVKASPTIRGGYGGTMISSTTPYTVLQHSVFEKFIQAFAQEVPKEAQVNPVAPFGLCFDPKKISAFPRVDLVMDRPNGPVWRISGEDSMVQVNGVKCLGVVDGGMQPRAAVTIGARQLEENVLVFDLARSRLGFSTSLPLRAHGLKCSDFFNFGNA